MSMLAEAVVHVIRCSPTRLAELLEPIASGTQRNQFLVAEPLKPLDISRSGGTEVFCNSVPIARFNYVGAYQLIDWINGFTWTEDDLLVMSIADEVGHQSLTQVHGGVVETRVFSS